MTRRLSTALFCSLAIFATAARADSVKVKIRVILVDKDLNQKPVPFLNLQLKNIAGAKPAVELKTGLDGTAETQLPEGRYMLSTPKAAELGNKRFTWKLEVALAGAEKKIDLTNDNAKVEEIAAAAPSAAAAPELTEQFKLLKNSVVTVLSESGHGTGFFVDARGLILTNSHVVEHSEYLAVQFDPEHKVAARLLASDSQKDVALLWAKTSSFPAAVAAPLAQAEAGKSAVQEGERVFTIGSPLTLDKILTTGVVSKVEPHTIMSDININPGNSGGPLFNSAGKVIGLTTFGNRGSSGPGVSGIVRIEEALPMLEQNRGKLAGVPPSDTLLPVAPAKPYPIEGLKAVLQAEKYDASPYHFNAGDFEVGISTPPSDFREDEEKRLKAERERQKRNKKQGHAADSSSTVETPRNWEAEAGAHKAIIRILVFPKAKEGFWSGMGRSMAPYSPAKVKFKTDFYKMRLLCGEKEIEPIHPGKIPLVMAVQNSAVSFNDSALAGIYTYGPDALSPSCGQVRLEIFPAKDLTQPVVKILEPKTIERVWGDFEAFRKAQTGPGATNTPTTPPATSAKP